MKLNISSKMQNILDKHGYTVCDPDAASTYCLFTIKTTLTTGDTFSKRLASHNSISSLIMSINDFYRETNDEIWYKAIDESIIKEQMRNEKTILENVEKIKNTLKALCGDLMENCPRIDSNMYELPLIILE